MASMVLLYGERDSVVARRVRIRDRLTARLKALRLDEALAAGASPDSSPALGLRARKLISERTRSDLGRALRRAVGEQGRCPSVVRLSAGRQTVVGASDLLGQLSRRLLSPAPVEAEGVAQARLLLSDGGGPLYWNRRAPEIRGRLQRAIEALEPRAPD